MPPSAPTFWKQQKASTWHIRHVAPKYKNYVVVIGERAFGLYECLRFPIARYAFLSRTKGLLINGYQSTAHATNLSLPQTLGLPGEPNNNIVSLAKQAGFRTAWLSNQGMLGHFANEISTYALRSDYPWFTQRGDYGKSAGLSDRLLLLKRSNGF